ncbi:hypothetical protein I548_5126 [Mycobacterium intracellulare]|nr:hypothetical protein I548_5126 [Mycobacterium intracellulare]
MKAEVAQQRSLLELSKLDAELSRLTHRAAHLPEQEACRRMQEEYDAAGDRIGAVRIALEDIDAHVKRLESEIDAVRQREDRDRALLQSGATDAKQLADLQHELETLQRRQTSLEDSLLEVMERREELQSQLDTEQKALETLEAEMAGARQALDAALAELTEARELHSSQRDSLSAALDPALSALYERQRAGEGRAPRSCWESGAGPAGSRSTAGSWPASRPPPKTTWCDARNAARSCCGSRDSISEGRHRSRRRITRQPRAGRLRRGGVDRGPRDRTRREQAGHRPGHQQRRRIPRPDSRFGRRPEAGRQRGRGVSGFQAAGGADVRAVEGQAPRPDRAACPGPSAGGAVRQDQLLVDSAGAQFARRSVGQRGDGRRGPGQRCGGDARAGRRARAPGAEAAKAVAAPSPTAPGWTGARGTPTRLLLLRHGQTELSVQRRYSGRGNPALTEVGRRQADAAARYLAQRGGFRRSSPPRCSGPTTPRRRRPRPWASM